MSVLSAVLLVAGADCTVGAAGAGVGAATVVLGVLECEHIIVIPEQYCFGCRSGFAVVG